MSQRFPPGARLRRRREFSDVFEAGVKRHGPLMTVVALAKVDGPARLGVAASRKVGSAVERNLAKRRLRELFRKSARPDALDLVVIPKRPLLRATFTAAEIEFTGLLNWAIRHARRPSARPPSSPRPGADRSV